MPLVVYVVRFLYKVRINCPLSDIYDIRKGFYLMNENGSNVIVNFIVRAIVGMAIIFFVNQYLDYRDISVSVGLNAVSFLTSGIFGIPGVALLYGIVLYQNL